MLIVTSEPILKRFCLIRRDFVIVICGFFPFHLFLGLCFTALILLDGGMEVNAVGKCRRWGKGGGGEMKAVETLIKWRWSESEGGGESRQWRKEGRGEIKAVVKWRLWWSGDDGKVKAIGENRWWGKGGGGEAEERCVCSVLYHLF